MAFVDGQYVYSPYNLQAKTLNDLVQQINDKFKYITMYNSGKAIPPHILQSKNFKHMALRDLKLSKMIQSNPWTSLLKLQQGCYIQWINQPLKSDGINLCCALLTQMNIMYQEEIKLPKYLNNKRFDIAFVYNGKKYIVEFDGRQHFTYVKFYHKSYDGFILHQETDRLKTNIAIKLGYTVIRLSNIVGIKHFLASTLQNSKNVKAALLYVDTPKDYSYLFMAPTPRLIAKICPNYNTIMVE